MTSRARCLRHARSGGAEGTSDAARGIGCSIRGTPAIGEDDHKGQQNVENAVPRSHLGWSVGTGGLPTHGHSSLSAIVAKAADLDLDPRAPSMRKESPHAYEGQQTPLARRPRHRRLYKQSADGRTVPCHGVSPIRNAKRGHRGRFAEQALLERSRAGCDRSSPYRSQKETEPSQRQP